MLVLSATGGVAETSAAPVSYKCAVVKLLNDAYFDTGLQQLGDGDEDYAYILIKEKGKRATIQVGGFEFPKAKTDTVVIKKENARTEALATTEDFGMIRFTHDFTNGRGTLHAGEKAAHKLIAELNCLHHLGIQPWQAPQLDLSAY